MGKSPGLGRFANPGSPASSNWSKTSANGRVEVVFDFTFVLLPIPKCALLEGETRVPASQDITTRRLGVSGLNLEIAFVDTKFSCCNGLGPMLARQKLLRAIEKQNAAWRLANIPCYLSLSPGWGISQSTLFVQWDPDRDVI